jgi:DNA polymerase-3 subunit delta'
LILPDGQTIKIEQIRELARLAALRPYEGPRKIFIVDEAERMPLVTANALLKTLEEPPDRTVLILILSQAKALPATVLSRCQLVRFAPLGEVDTLAILREHGADEVTARFLARACQGRVGMALVQEPAAWRERRDSAVALLSKVSAEGVEALFNSVETLGRDRSQVAALIEALWLWHRDLLCAKAGSDPRLLISGDHQAELTSAAGLTSWELLFEALAACREAWQALQANVSPRLTVEVLLSRLALKAA